MRGRQAAPSAFTALLFVIFTSAGTAHSDAAAIKSTVDSVSTVRRLEDEFEYDISEYSVRFGKCQYVKTFDDDFAEDEDSETVFALKHFVVFRLCPSDQCDTCETGYGEYVLEVDDYLQATVEAQKEALESYCESCEENCNDDGDCDGECQEECYKYENLEDNGYVDASEYIECNKADVEGYDDDDMNIYIGPRCSSDGSKIYIDIFQDENCWEPLELPDGQTVEDVIGYNISYHILKNTYSGDPSDCLSCAEERDDQNDDQNEDDEEDQDEDNINEMCEGLYDLSAKCESIHGIPYGLIQMNQEEEDDENQVENEFAVCGFINSLVWNSYTETGEINIFDEQDVIVRETTTLQKGALSLLSMGAVSLAGYAAYLHRAIDEGFPNIDLACQGGQMAWSDHNSSPFLLRQKFKG